MGEINAVGTLGAAGVTIFIREFKFGFRLPENVSVDARQPKLVMTNIIVLTNLVISLIVPPYDEITSMT